MQSCTTSAMTSSRRDDLGAAPYVPEGASLDELRVAAQSCRGCPLWEHATQAVLGAGAPRARIVLVGEQPGDREDVEGAPFVGPAGRLLDAILEEAGIDRGEVYVTNAVKHFKWEPRGRKRIHQKPRAREIEACRPWLDAELSRVRPRGLVLLGATAAQAFFGSSFRITKERGHLRETESGLPALATHHPAAALRAPDREVRARMRAELAHDLRAMAEHVSASFPTPRTKARAGHRIRAPRP